MAEHTLVVQQEARPVTRPDVDKYNKPCLLNVWELGNGYSLRMKSRYDVAGLYQGERKLVKVTSCGSYKGIRRFCFKDSARTEGYLRKAGLTPIRTDNPYASELSC